MLYSRFLTDNETIHLSLDIMKNITSDKYAEICNKFNVTRFYNLHSKTLILLYNKYVANATIPKKPIPVAYLVNNCWSSLYRQHTYKASY